MILIKIFKRLHTELKAVYEVIQKSFFCIIELKVQNMNHDVKAFLKNFHMNFSGVEKIVFINAAGKYRSTSK